jgi:hypothetical protein
VGDADLWIHTEYWEMDAEGFDLKAGLFRRFIRQVTKSGLPFWE